MGIKQWIHSEKISAAKTIFLNGTMGIFEEKTSEYGTKSIMKIITVAEGFSVIGGGALIRFLSGEELPVVKALKKGSNI